MRTKVFNFGKVPFVLDENGAIKGFILKRDLSPKECKHILTKIFGYEISTREEFLSSLMYVEYVDKYTATLNKWLRGDADRVALSELNQTFWAPVDQLGGNIFLITDYLKKKGII